MTQPRDVADVVTGELLQLRRKVLDGIALDGTPFPEAQDAYVSALLGHLFAVLLTKIGPGGLGLVDKSPEALADALNLIARKTTVIAGSLDPSADYKIQTLRREKE